MADEIFLTKEWLEEIQKELEQLKTVKRVEIAEKLKEAISYWDLRENAEYEEARTEQAQVELRIIELEDLLKNYELIEEDGSKAKKQDKVTIWSMVTISFVDDEWKEIKEAFKIVWSTESDILDDETPKISNESPVWKSLIGKKVWDIAKGKSWAWDFSYKILEVK